MNVVGVSAKVFEVSFKSGSANCAYLTSISVCPVHSALFDQKGFNENEILSNCSEMKGYLKSTFFGLRDHSGVQRVHHHYPWILIHQKNITISRNLGEVFGKSDL